MSQDKESKTNKALLHLAAQIDSLNQSVEILSGVLANHKKRISNIENKGLPLTTLIEENKLSLN